MSLFATLEMYISRVVERLHGDGAEEKPVHSEQNAKVRLVAQEMGVVASLSVYETSEISRVIRGSNYPESRAFVYLNPKDPKYVIAHELAHLKFNDNLILYAFLGSVWFFGSLGMYTFNNVQVGVLTTLIGFVASRTLSRYQEKRADLEAWKLLNFEEKKEMIEDLKRIQSHYKAIHQDRLAKSSMWEKIATYLQYDSEGELRWFLNTHPSCSTRIANLK